MSKEETLILLKVTLLLVNVMDLLKELTETEGRAQ